MADLTDAQRRLAHEVAELVTALQRREDAMKGHCGNNSPHGPHAYDGGWCNGSFGG